MEQEEYLYPKGSRGWVSGRIETRNSEHWKFKCGRFAYMHIYTASSPSARFEWSTDRTRRSRPLGIIASKTWRSTCCLVVCVPQWALRHASFFSCYFLLATRRSISIGPRYFSLLSARTALTAVLAPSFILSPSLLRPMYNSLSSRFSLTKFRVHSLPRTAALIIDTPLFDHKHEWNLSAS